MVGEQTTPLGEEQQQDRPMIVQGDSTILFEVENQSYQECRDWLARFAELVKSPEHVHTYRLTSLAIWNAAASGLKCEEVLRVLQRFSRYEVPQNVLSDIRDWFSRYGKIKLEKMTATTDEGAENAQVALTPSTQVLALRSVDEVLITEILNNNIIVQFVTRREDSNTLLVDGAHRGRLKQALTKMGYPVEDLVGYLPGEPLPIARRETLLTTTQPFVLRKYQLDSADAFYASGSERGGSGVIVLPCGAGKTIVGMEIMSRIGEETLIIGSSTVGVRQWITELLDKTTLTGDMMGEYTGDLKEVKPVTVTTYQCLTYAKRKGKKGGNNDDASLDDHDGVESEEGGKSPRSYPHLEIFKAKNWGLIIYDEVHLLPAPVFRMTAELQAKRRLGLTATLVREDGREDNVFSLIGPKRFDAPWKELESQGWIAEAVCYEIRVEMMDRDYRMKYATAPQRMKYRVAAENPKKLGVVERLISEHAKNDDSILVIGDYLDQLGKISRLAKAPLISGKLPNSERERLYSSFRRGEQKLLVVSKVANYAIDLPDASVAIQVSGTFGSRQEEAQRLGRLLRPKNGKQAHFYTVISRDTVDQDYASRRQLFLTEKGYKYIIVDEQGMVER